MARSVQILLTVDDRGSAKVRKFGKTVESTSAKASRTSARNFDRMQKKVGASIDKVTKKAVQWGGLIGVIFAGVAVRSVIKFGAEFEKSMSGVSAVTSATGREMEKLTGLARELGATTAFSAIEAATAMEELGKAGFTTNEITATLPDVLNLAGAGMLEMAEAASITSDLMRSLGIDLVDFSFATDVLAMTAISSKTTISELGFAFQDAAPVARSLGIDITGLSSLLGILANRGFTATRAGTALRRIFAVFLGDLEDGEKGLAGMGIELKKNADGTADFATVLDQFTEAGVDANDIMEAFGLRGGPAMLQIVAAGASQLRDFEEALAGSAGTAARVFEERFNNLTGVWKEFTSAMQEATLVLFDKVGPALSASVESARDFARAWGKNLAVSDVLGGLARVATAAKIAFVGLGVAIGAGLVRKFAALLLSLLETVAGMSVAQLSAARLSGAYNLLAAASLKAKVAVAGIGLAAFAAGWQIGRIIGEVTGLDGVLQNFIITAAGLGKSKQGAVNAAAGFNAIAKGVERLGEAGLELNLDDQVQAVFDEIDAIAKRSDAEVTVGWNLASLESDKGAEAVERFVASARGRLNIEAQLRLDPEATDAAAHQIIAFQKQVARLTDEQLPDFVEAFNKAGEAGKKGAAQMAFGFAEVDRILKESHDLAVETFTNKAEDLAQGAKAIESAFSSAGLATEEMGNALAMDLVLALEYAKEKGIESDLVFKAFGETVTEMAASLERSAVEIPLPLAQAVEELRRLRDEAEALAQEIFDAGLDGPVSEVDDVRAGVTIDPIPIDELFTGRPELGDPEPPDPEPWVQYFQEIGEVADEFVDNIGFAWADFTEGAIDQFSSLAGAVATGQVKLMDGFTRLLQQTASQAIKLLVQWGIQRLIASKLAAASTTAEGSASLGVSAANIFATVFGSLSATPIVGPAIAIAQTPGITTAAMGAAAGAGAAGAALGGGLGSVAAAAEGGLISQRHFVEVGERGDELVTPLRGSAARRAREELGLEELLEGQRTFDREASRDEGSEGGIQLELNVYGDNWSRGDLDANLAEVVYRGLEDLILTGRRQALPTGRT